MAITGERIIYNMALDYIGEYYVSDDTATDTKQYPACERNYDDARDEALIAHPWNEAKVRVIIAQASDKPVFGYNLKFAKPSDCLRVLSVNDSTGADVSNNQAGVEAWEVEGEYIFSDSGESPQSWVTEKDYYDGEFFTDDDVTYEVLVSHTSDTVADDETAAYIVSAGGDYKVIYVEYIQQLADTTKFSSLLKKVIAVNLAIKVSSHITNDTKTKHGLIEEYEKLLLPKARSVDAQQGKPRKLFSSEWLRARRSGSGGWYVT